MYAFVEKAPPTPKGESAGGSDGAGGSGGKAAGKGKGKGKKADKAEPAEGGKPKKEKKVKDPNAPKKNLTAFMYFSNSNRDKVKTENPGKWRGQPSFSRRAMCPSRYLRSEVLAFLWCNAGPPLLVRATLSGSIRRRYCRHRIRRGRQDAGRALEGYERRR